MILISLIITFFQLIRSIDAFQTGKYDLKAIHTLRNVQRTQRMRSYCSLCPTDGNIREEDKIFFQRLHEKTYTARDARINLPSFLLLSSLAAPSSVLAANDDTSPASTAFQTALDLNFPSALPNSELISLLIPKLEKRGYTKENTIIATSICSDELNTSEKSLESQLRQRLLPGKYDGVFHLGGLAGVPFVGISGFKAMLGHVPTRGKVVLVFGPHIGIDDSGAVGKVLRKGQDDKLTSSCGAVVGASKVLASRALTPRVLVPEASTEKKNPSEVVKQEKLTLSDEQEDFIISYLSQKSRESGGTSEDLSITTLTDNMYILIRDEVVRNLKACVNADPTAFWTNISEITLLGGIVLNKSYKPNRKDEDLFFPLMLSTLNVRGVQDVIF